MGIVKSIRIQNFKSLEDVTIDLSQLTFLFGANSSGKSSFLKALMFLAKNLYPGEYAGAKYSISDDVDLGSANEVAPFGNRHKDWIFEFELDGYAEFPSLELFETSTELEYQTLGDFFMYEVRQMLKDKEARSKKFTTERVSATYSLSFGEILYSHPGEKDPLQLHNKSIKKIFLKEHQTNCEYSFLKNQTTEDPANPNDMYYILDQEEVIIPEFKELSQLFNMYFGQRLFRSLFELGDYNIVQRKNIDNFPTLKSLLSIDFNSIHVNGDENLESAIASWQMLDTDKKIEFYYFYTRFFYLSLVAVPNEIQRLLDYFHLPTTRIMPKRVFLKKDNEFPSNEYYDLLNFLSSESDFLDFLDKEAKSLGRGLLETLAVVCEPKSEKMFPSRAHSRFTDISLFTNEPFFVINNWIRKFGFDFLYKITTTEDIGKIQLVKNDGTISILSDASSGFIQLFPIIVRSCILIHNARNGSSDLIKFTLKSGENQFDWKTERGGNHSTLLIEQPELHLHPKLQSELAVFFNYVISRIGTDRRLFIETHSEHLIRKLQVLIAKGELAREKVGVWYFKKVNGVTKVEKMEIDENGLFKNDWPDGFFDDSTDLTMELFEALRKRKN